MLGGFPAGGEDFQAHVAARLGPFVVLLSQNGADEADNGAADMLCRVVAPSNADLQRVLDAIVSTAGVVRSATLISLAPGALPRPAPSPGDRHVEP